MTALLTSSRLKDARACQRLHQLKYVLGYRQRETAEDLRFGSLVHKGLEAWWRSIQAKQTEENTLFNAIDALRREKSDPFELVRAEEMLCAYHVRWAPDVTGVEVLGVEMKFEGPLINPATGAPSRTWRLAGKMDVLVRMPNGDVVIIEHKTAGTDIAPGSTYWKRLLMDGQVSTYFEGSGFLGYPATKCLYDVLAKPALRPKQATPLEHRKYLEKDAKDGRKKGDLYAGQRATDESVDEYRERVRADIAAAPDAYLQRGDVVRLESEVEEARFDVWQIASQLREAANAGRYPRNPDSCVRYERTCEFFGVCTGADSLENDRLFIKSADVHPELSPDQPALAGSTNSNSEQATKEVA